MARKKKTEVAAEAAISVPDNSTGENGRDIAGDTAGGVSADVGVVDAVDRADEATEPAGIDGTAPTVFVLRGAASYATAAFPKFFAVKDRPFAVTDPKLAAHLRSCVLFEERR